MTIPSAKCKDGWGASYGGVVRSIIEEQREVDTVG
jgi:hypothetical protein